MTLLQICESFVLIYNCMKDPYFNEPGHESPMTWVRNVGNDAVKIAWCGGCFGLKWW